MLGFLLSLMLGAVGDVRVVAGFGLVVVRGRNGDRAEDGGTNRKEQSKREEEAVRPGHRAEAGAPLPRAG